MDAGVRNFPNVIVTSCHLRGKMLWPEIEGPQIQSALRDKDLEYTMAHMRATETLTHSRLFKFVDV